MKYQNSQILKEASIAKLLLKFSLPATIGMLMQTLYSLVDTIFIGHAVGSIGIAALSTVFPIQIIFVGIAQICGIGGASLISIALGAKNHAEAEAILGNAWFLGIIIALIFPFILLPYSESILQFLGVTHSIMPYARSYFTITVFGFVFMMFYIIGINAIRAEGNPKAPMFIMFGSTLGNIILDAFFIFGLHKGMTGAALATVTTQCLTAFYVLYFFLCNKSNLKIKIKLFVIQKIIIYKIFAVGLPSFLRMTTNSIILVILNRLLGMYGGDAAIAVYGILNRIMIFTNLPVLGIAEGLQPIIGFSYGAKLYQRLLKAVRLASSLASVYSLLLFICLIIFSQSIIHLFTNDIGIYISSSKALRIIAPALISLGFQTVAAGMFQSIGKAKPSLFLSLLRNVFLFIPLVFILSYYYQVNGIWWSFPLAYCSAFLITLTMFVWQMRCFSFELENKI